MISPYSLLIVQLNCIKCVLSMDPVLLGYLETVPSNGFVRYQRICLWVANINDYMNHSSKKKNIFSHCKVKCSELTTADLEARQKACTNLFFPFPHCQKQENPLASLGSNFPVHAFILKGRIMNQPMSSFSTKLKTGMNFSEKSV